MGEYALRVETIACRSVRVRPGWLVTAPASILLAVCLPLFAGLLDVVLVHGMSVPWELFGTAVLGPLVAGYLLLKRRPGHHHVLELSDGAIRIRPADGPRRGVHVRRVVRADAIEDGYAPSADRVVLRLAHGVRVEAQLASERAEDVLDHLGVTLEQRTLSVRLRAELGTFTRVLLAWTLTGIVASIVIIGPELLPPAIAIAVSQALAAAAAIAVGVWLRPRAVVGRDGVRIVGVLRPRFIPYSRIRRAERWYFQGVQNVVGQAIGAAITLDTPAGQLHLPTYGQSEEQIDALIAHIEQGRAACAAVEAPSLELLDRRERSIESWRKALRSMMLEEGGFRGAALGQAELDDVLADPGAPLERRVAAALALRTSDEGARRRIRVAAETSAEPHVRAALQAAGADKLDNRAIAHALDKLDDAEAAVRMLPANPDRAG